MTLNDLPKVPKGPQGLPGKLELGAFSISLNVKDLDASKTFYEKLGFEVTGGSADHNYLILKNGPTTLGLFQGMFEQNILTFNPGLTDRMELIEDYTDVREVQKKLQDAGLELGQVVESESGPASITLIDPDGNPILIDQHF